MKTLKVTEVQAVLRTVEKRVPDGWEEIRLMDLKAGDEFRMFEYEDCEPITSGGMSLFTAIEPPIFNDYNFTWTIEVETLRG